MSLRPNEITRTVHTTLASLAENDLLSRLSDVHYYYTAMSDKIRFHDNHDNVRI